MTATKLANDLGKGASPFSHSTACLPILLLHLSKVVLRRTEVGERLVGMVVEVVLARRDLLQRAVDVLVQPGEL